MENQIKLKIDQLKQYFDQMNEAILEMSPKYEILERLKVAEMKINKLKNGELVGLRKKDIEPLINDLKEEIDKIYEDCKPPEENPYESHFISGF